MGTEKVIQVLESQLVAYLREVGEYDVAKETDTLLQSQGGDYKVQLAVVAFSIGQVLGDSKVDRTRVEEMLTTLSFTLELDNAPIMDALEKGTGSPRGHRFDLDPLPKFKPKHRKIGSKLTGEEANTAIEDAKDLPTYIQLRRSIKAALGEKKVGGKGMVCAADRRRKAGGHLTQWLNEYGYFLQTTSDYYYFYEPDKALIKLGTNKWRAWLYALTGVNPAGTDFAYFNADCETQGIFAEYRDVYKLSHWDGDKLFVSRFDGVVYVLDGDTITQEANGVNALFEDDADPYEPGECDGSLDWLCELPNWENDNDAYAVGFKAWIMSAFFSELCPTKPFAVFMGESRSGKTTTMRLLLKLLYGRQGEVHSPPEKRDDFVAMAANNHILVLDNFDQFKGWLKDDLARVSSGSLIKGRRLYTTMEEYGIVPRCWVGFTAITPDTLRRSDLVERTLFFPVHMIENRSRETILRDYAETHRDAWWAEVLQLLNRMVTGVKQGIPDNFRLTIPDWEGLGNMLSVIEGKETLWKQFITNTKNNQCGFLLEDDLIVSGIMLWLENEDNQGREVATRVLYSEVTDLLFPGKPAPRDWPRSVMSFSKRLSSIRQALKAVFSIEWWHERKVLQYKFSSGDF